MDVRKIESCRDAQMLRCLTFIVVSVHVGGVKCGEQRGGSLSKEGRSRSPTHSLTHSHTNKLRKNTVIHSIKGSQLRKADETFPSHSQTHLAKKKKFIPSHTLTHKFSPGRPRPSRHLTHSLIPRSLIILPQVPTRHPYLPPTHITPIHH
ncbi:hypothetical protein L207DRAFT_107486 [Hyaloscypha variabilis F]|uniref:Uncharacterized protein n=1 Tax=Hyaloscypha variabilis (strain UAMH 11265 / GT02V1 / F) TaxID=1149755 RepID=A0A2J6R9G1_HYAVF|nr:hypothetical protein L207DRAFT_107486 [Hyaloscypha variabilis F]